MTTSDQEAYIPVAVLASKPQVDVLKVLSSGGSFRAVKRFKNFDAMDQEMKDAVIREVVIHRALHHPHIIPLVDSFICEGDVCLVMNYAAGGTLKDHVDSHGGLPEDWARWLFQQIMLTVEYVHSRGMVHRDIKADNVLLNDEKSVTFLAHFESSWNVAENGNPNTAAGTSDYMAPEILQKMYFPAAHRIEEYDGKAADVYSLGVLLFYILFGRCPFEQLHGLPFLAFAQQVVQQLAQGEIQIPSHNARDAQISLSNGVGDLLRRMLTGNPQQRITIEEIIQLPWFQESLPERWADCNPNIRFGAMNE